MRLYPCDKTVLRFHPKAAAFLNGYTTNTIDAPRTAFVDIHGRIIAVGEQSKKSEDEVWVAVERPFVERLLKHLEKYLAISDTRAERLPHRCYWDLDKDLLVISDKELSANVSEDEFLRYRLERRMPVQGKDFDQEMLLNLGDESLVSYNKGCYLGQEIIARVHYKGRPPKRLEVRDGRFVFVENT